MIKCHLKIPESLESKNYQIFQQNKSSKKKLNFCSSFSIYSPNNSIIQTAENESIIKGNSKSIDLGKPSNIPYCARFLTPFVK